MADKTDINSTEKLLNTIRGTKQVAGGGDAGDAPLLFPQKAPFPPQDKKLLARFFPDKKNYTIGVDIGQEFIYLAKTVKSSNGNPVLLDQKILKYDGKTPPGSPEFNAFLKASLLSICGNPANCNIWTLIPAAEVNINHLKIPPVPKKQLENAIYWAAKKEASFDEKDFIFDFEIQEDVIDQGIPKHSVLVYSAPKVQIEKTKALFSNIGITTAGITIAPFAIQNIFRTRWLPVNEGTAATLFVGNEFSRIDIYNKGNLVLTRGIKTGVSSMMEAISESFANRNNPAVLGRADHEKILRSLDGGTDKLSENDAGFGLSEQEIFGMIAPAVERLVRQIERTLEYYANSGSHEKVEKIYISSVLNIYRRLSAYIGEQLGIKIEIMDPFRYQMNNRVIESISSEDRVSLAVALGLSFSDNRNTPNAVFTYKEKNREVAVKRINHAVMGAFAAALIICITALAYQSREMVALKDRKTVLEKQLAVQAPLVSADKVTKLANDLKTQRNISRQYAERYLGVAVIGEVAALTPPHVKLINLSIIGSNSTSGKEKTVKTTADARDRAERITLEGIITGERNMLDSYLAQYIMRLGNSQMLRQVAVYKNNVVNFKKTEVLQFTMSAKVGK